ncbi:hypothetical protein RDn1_113 [Candidatus Termititenax dinenymphae]|uniref:Uracil-DNA glycosylase n=1 Tax=Candidatus Termititenax dinenymphae TaxID=2218523 RepID=A0A388TL51_9BACT|nr:hypothetical protein RDn1_113 [Candidatus Termititenax dinenymphae]
MILMKNQKEFEKITKEIFKCKKCTLHQDQIVKKIKYKHNPEFPIPYKDIDEYKTFAVGINPSWNKESEDFLKEYKSGTFEEYIDVRRKHENNIHSTQYISGIRSTLQRIGIEIEDNQWLWKQVLWANLSFCSSQTPDKRIFLDTQAEEKEISCNVFSEEIPNCLDAGYLRRLIGIFKPKLILFFTTEINRLHYTQILKYCFNKEIMEINKKFIEKDVIHSMPINKKNTKVKIAVVKIDKTICAFLPHPSRKKYIKKEKLEKIEEEIKTRIENLK